VRLAFAFLVLGCGLFYSLAAAAKTTSALGGKLRIQLPAGFTPLSRSEIEAKFPPLRPPQLVYGNAERNVTIAVTHSDSKLAPQQYSQFATYMKLMLQTRMTVQEDEMIDIGGRRWIRLAGTAQAIDQPIHNEMLMTSLDNRALIVNLNCVTRLLPKYKKSLRAVRDSLRLL
jgi:hypothetical protein